MRFKTVWVGFALLVHAGSVGCSDDDGPDGPSPGGSAGSSGQGGTGAAGSAGQGGTAAGNSGSGGTAAGSGGQGGASGSAGSGGSGGEESCTRDPATDAQCADFMPDTPSAWICPTLEARNELLRQYDHECWNVNFVSGYGHCCPAD